MTEVKLRDRARLIVTVCVAMAHGAFAILDLIDRLSFTVDSRYDTVQAAAESPLWLPAFLFCFFAILVGMGNHQILSKIFSVSVVVMGLWSFFTFLWGMYPERSVSLAGPTLGFIVTGVSQGLAIAYAGEPHERQE